MIRLFLETAIPMTLQFCQFIGPIPTAEFSEGHFTWGNYRLNQFSLYASVTKLESRVSELKMFSQRNLLVNSLPQITAYWPIKGRSSPIPSLVTHTHQRYYHNNMMNGRVLGE